jgi:hypothetical protein
MQVAKQRFLPAAKRIEGHRGSNANIDTDIAGFRFVAEFSGNRSAGGKNAGLISIRPAIDKLQCFFDGAGVYQANRSEYPGFSKPAFRLDVCQ